MRMYTHKNRMRFALETRLNFLPFDARERTRNILSGLNAFLQGCESGWDAIIFGYVLCLLYIYSQQDVCFFQPLGAVPGWINLIKFGLAQDLFYAAPRIDFLRALSLGIKVEKWFRCKRIYAPFNLIMHTAFTLITFQWVLITPGGILISFLYFSKKVFPSTK